MRKVAFNLANEDTVIVSPLQPSQLIAPGNSHLGNDNNQIII